MNPMISTISTPGWSGAGLAVSLMIALSAPHSMLVESVASSCFPARNGDCSSRHLRQIIKDHEMGLFDYHVGKHRRLPAGVLFALRHTFRDIQFLVTLAL